MYIVVRVVFIRFLDFDFDKDGARADVEAGS